MYNIVIGAKYDLDGETKTRWTKVGEAFKSHKGFSIRLDVPVLTSPGQSTWFNLFEKENKQNGISEKNESSEE